MIFNSKNHNSLFIIHDSIQGFSLVEVILALAIFVILAVTGITTILQSFSVNKLGEEQTNADLYAQEGLEAVRSIKDQGWSNLSAGNKVLSTTGGKWSFNGATDTKDKYSRQINISSVNRDLNGNIVESGGNIDVDTLKVTSTVSWNFSGPRNDTVSYSTYLTNFRKPINTNGDALILYPDGTGTPKWRTFDGSAGMFGNKADVLVGETGRNFIIRTSPTKREAIAGYVGSTGNLRVLCFDGTSWSEEWTQSVGGAGTTRRFDISYETNSGDAVVFYNNNNTNQLGYRVKSGATSCGSANWSANATYTPKTTGIIHWIKIAWDRRPSSDLIAVIWADANSDLSAAIWNGSNIVNEPGVVSETSLEVVSASQDVDDFDVEYESISGNVMVVWANSAGSNGTNGVRYRLCTNGSATCSWGNVVTPPTWKDDATNLDISANPDSNEMVFASIGNSGCDLQVGYWNGNGWTNNINTDVSAVSPTAGTGLARTGWLISGGITRSVVVYNDATSNTCGTSNGTQNIGWYVGNGGTFTVQGDWTPAPLFANPQKWYDIQTDPKNKERFVFTLSDGANDLHSKYLMMNATPVFTWSNTEGGNALEINLPQVISGPFSFAWWRNP